MHVFYSKFDSGPIVKIVDHQSLQEEVRIK